MQNTMSTAKLHPRVGLIHNEFVQGRSSGLADITGDDIESAADQQQQKAAKGKHGGLSARRHVLADARYLWNWGIKKRF